MTIRWGTVIKERVVYVFEGQQHTHSDQDRREKEQTRKCIQKIVCPQATQHIKATRQVRLVIHYQELQCVQSLPTARVHLKRIKGTRRCKDREVQLEALSTVSVYLFCCYKIFWPLTWRFRSFWPIRRGSEKIPLTWTIALQCSDFSPERGAGRQGGNSYGEEDLEGERTRPVKSFAFCTRGRSPGTTFEMTLNGKNGCEGILNASG